MNKWCSDWWGLFFQHVTITDYHLYWNIDGAATNAHIENLNASRALIFRISQHSVLCIHVSAFVCFSFPKRVFSVLKALTQKKIGSWSFRSAGFENVVLKWPSSLRSTFKPGIATSGIASGPSGIVAMVSCTPSFGVFSLNCFTKHDNWQNIQNDAHKNVLEIKYFIDFLVIVLITLKSWSQYVFWAGDQELWSS